MNCEHFDEAILRHGQCENAFCIGIHFIYDIRNEFHAGGIDVNEWRLNFRILMGDEMLITGREIFENSSR